MPLPKKPSQSPPPFSPEHSPTARAEPRSLQICGFCLLGPREYIGSFEWSAVFCLPLEGSLASQFVETKCACESFAKLNRFVVGEHFTLQVKQN
ncbi:hypothetical protein NL676_011734 [Syzygium grande]|nr:hypothetical protein NL676_011734 [Syzygium grande]